MKVVNNIIELIGNTPMLKISHMTEENWADVYLKLEYFNPGGSVKDRPALYMIEEAEKCGKLKSGSVIVEPTSGNTGIGLAMVGASKGYQVILVMPETMSIERRNLLKAYGAEVFLTPGASGMSGAVEKAEELVRENENYFMPYQFKNKDNPKAHEKTTALEIINQMDGSIDAFVAGIGTGGTITGIGKVLKNEIPDAKIIGIEPKSSPIISGGKPGPHKIQGIGANFIPEILDVEILDEVETVSDEDAINTTIMLAKKEGLLVGISSGAAAFAALKWAKKMGKGKKIVAIAPDTGERYLSTGIYE
ncbi:cysteine synthase A [Sporanaerobacter acetigenes]|uniref:Cysteine synthase n=1 Tax=Sporanaerobacter acetigenes DSM 13106 TaxID=1123281 RepID=A0A1M5UL41_9FIRM|nr:cysteine synthase A [Sporanaerobacter acetigenes]SHH63578.1 cysteine synthase A [Sporanaerobacter acetigenes DSM 13106]